ncbi:hypothetical protein M3J09_005443 [Ascochyta lentis]
MKLIYALAVFIGGGSCVPACATAPSKNPNTSSYASSEFASQGNGDLHSGSADAILVTYSPAKNLSITNNFKDRNIVQIRAANGSKFYWINAGDTCAVTVDIQSPNAVFYYKA